MRPAVELVLLLFLVLVVILPANMHKFSLQVLSGHFDLANEQIEFF